MTSRSKRPGADWRDTLHEWLARDHEPTVPAPDGFRDEFRRMMLGLLVENPAVWARYYRTLCPSCGADALSWGRGPHVWRRLALEDRAALRGTLAGRVFRDPLSVATLCTRCGWAESYTPLD